MVAARAVPWRPSCVRGSARGGSGRFRRFRRRLVRTVGDRPVVADDLADDEVQELSGAGCPTPGPAAGTNRHQVREVSATTHAAEAAFHTRSPTFCSRSELGGPSPERLPNDLPSSQVTRHALGDPTGRPLPCGRGRPCRAVAKVPPTLGRPTGLNPRRHDARRSGELGTAVPASRFENDCLRVVGLVLLVTAGICRHRKFWSQHARVFVKIHPPTFHRKNPPTKVTSQGARSVVAGWEI